MSDWELLTPLARLTTKPISDGSGLILRETISVGGTAGWLKHHTQIDLSDDELGALARKSPEHQRLVRIIRAFSEGYTPTDDCHCDLCEAHREASDILKERNPS